MRPVFLKTTNTQTESHIMTRIPQPCYRLDTLMNCKWTITLHLQLGGCLEFHSVCIASLDSAAPLVSLCINPQLNFFPRGMLQPQHSLSTPKVLLSPQVSEQSHLGSPPCFSASPRCLFPYQAEFGHKSGVPFLSPSSSVLLIQYTRSSILKEQPRSGLGVLVGHPSYL